MSFSRHDTGPESEELGLVDYWRILRRRKRFIAVIATAILVIGGVATFLKTPLYRGEATILVEDNKSSQLDVLDNLGSLAGAIPVETEMEILKSRTIAEEVVRELGLDALPIDAPFGTRLRLRDYESKTHIAYEDPEYRIKIGSDRAHYEVFSENGEKLGAGALGRPFVGQNVSWQLDVTTPVPVSTIRFRKIPFQAAVRALRSSMTVQEVGKKTNVIRITIDAPDPFGARDIANAITEAYLAHNIARKGQVASQTLDFIGEQLDAIRGNLEAGEHELGNYKSRMGIFVLSDSAKNIIDQIGKLETARADIQLQERDVTGLLSALEHAGERDGPYILGEVALPDPVIGRLVTELAKYLIELRSMRQELKEDNPKVILAKAQIDEAKSKVRFAVQNARKSLRNRDATVTGLIQGYEERLKRLPENERELATLTRKSEVNAELYTFLLKKHEEARITRAGIVGNVRVLDSSLVPESPESPQKKRNLVIFVLLGLLVGISGAFLLEYLDDTFKSIDEITTDLGLGIYGVIPYVEHADNEPIFIDKLDPRGPVQEAFRSFRTNIQFTDSQQQMRSLIVVSALPGVGKSTATANLAVVLAQGGSRVLLVDCDLRRPQVHRFFQLPSEPGLTNGLLSDKGWRSFVVGRTGIERLSVLAAGILPPNPAEFLGSQRFQAFMREAGEAYDYVLYDAPPIIAFTDAAIIAARADAVFLVLELGRSQVPLLKRALALLGNVQAKVRGAIVNKAGASGDADYGYGYYSYSLQYYYDEEVRPPRNKLIEFLRRILQ